MWVIDPSQRTLARTIDLAPFGRLHAVLVDDAGRLYVLSEKDSMLIRLDDPASGKGLSRLIPVGGTRTVAADDGIMAARLRR